LSLTANQTIGGIASADEDVLYFDGTNWSLFFDGSDVGVGGVDLVGFSMLNPNALLMSFSGALTLNGIAVTPQDIVRFQANSLGSNTAGTFSMYLDGSDVGLDTTAENIDAISLLPDGRVLVSTSGSPALTGITGARDEDILAFTPTTLGDVTAGSWGMYFDGSDVGLGETSYEDIDAMDIAFNGQVYLSTRGDFAVSGLSGADEDVFICTPLSLGDTTACSYSGMPFFDGSAFGLAANGVDAVQLAGTGPAATSTPGAATATATVAPSATSNGIDIIFSDGFESGNLSAWTGNVADAGDLSVSSLAAMLESRGMQVQIDDTTAIYVRDDSPAAERRYRARFYFDPNSISMASGNAHYLFAGHTGNSPALRVEFRLYSGNYQLRARLVDDGGTWRSTNWFSISDAPHPVEIDWRAATGAGANNGGLTMWIDGIQQADLAAVDNDTRMIDSVRLGAISAMDSTTLGTYYLDAFESRRQSYIGP
jgi:hypothetical protein